MNVSYKADGLDELVSSLIKQKKFVERKVEEEIKLSATRISHKAKGYARVDTSLMRESIFTEKQGRLSYDITSPVFYSIFNELGTRKMSAQPFIYPALKDDFPILVRRLTNFMK